ncbi:MAG: acyltransferase [Terrimesophilobacter sp.]
MRRVRLDSLTGLRWWAAFGVFAFHMRNLAPLPFDDLLAIGNAGVTFFFILSGFVLTWSSRPEVTTPTFWWRRFARIWPAHMVALIVAVPVFYSFAAHPTDAWVKPFSLGILLLSVILIQGWWRDPTILFSGNPAAWTLTCEAFFYALHPAINRVLGRLAKRGALILAVSTVAVAVAYRVCVLNFPGSVFGEVPWPIVRLTEFVIGMALARAIASGWRVTLKPLWCYLIGGLLLGVIGFGERLSDRIPPLSAILPFSNEIIIVIFAATIAAIAARDLRGEPSLLRSRLLVALGDMSYAFYLLHATIIYFLLSIIGVHGFGVATVPVWLLGLSLSIGGAAILHYLIERPIEKRMRRWKDARDVTRSAAQELRENTR